MSFSNEINPEEVSCLGDLKPGGFLSSELAAVILFGFMCGDLLIRLHESESRAESEEKFERESPECEYRLEVTYGNAYEVLCRHPERDDQRSWVMCDKDLCPSRVDGQGDTEWARKPV